MPLFSICAATTRRRTTRWRRNLRTASSKRRTAFRGARGDGKIRGSSPLSAAPLTWFHHGPDRSGNGRRGRSSRERFACARQSDPDWPGHGERCRRLLRFAFARRNGLARGGGRGGHGGSTHRFSQRRAAGSPSDDAAGGETRNFQRKPNERNGGVRFRIRSPAFERSRPARGHQSRDRSLSVGPGQPARGETPPLHDPVVQRAVDVITSIGVLQKQPSRSP